MKKSTLLLCVLAAVVCLASCKMYVADDADVEDRAFVSANRANVRQKPNGKVIATLSRNTSVGVLSAKDGWTHVTFTNSKGSSDSGYVASSLLSEQKAGTGVKAIVKKEVKVVAKAARWGKLKYVHAAVNVRAARETGAKVVRTLAAGQQVKVDYLKGKWYAVFDPDETSRDIDKAIGYIYAPLLKDKPLVEAAKEASAEKKEVKTVKKAIKRSTAKRVLKYRIAKQDRSRFGRPRVIYWIVVDVNMVPSEESLKKTAGQIWGSMKKDFVKFLVYVYLPDMDTDGAAYATAEFTPEGLNSFKVNEAALSGTKWGSD